MVIPFTLCSLLFCRDRTRERARVAHRHHPGDPGSRPGKSPLARSMMLMSSDFRVGDQPASLQAIPSARFPAGGPGQPQRLIDFQPDPVIAVIVLFLLSGVIAVRRKITGDSSAPGERGHPVSPVSAAPPGTIPGWRRRYFIRAMFSMRAERGFLPLPVEEDRGEGIQPHPSFLFTPSN
ncbi:hypothetical protein EDC53_11964 [Phytobacter diazotrophicus]|nr:hypothetical protein EDC53_11964 [Phytobacter diazotrophicus]